MAVSKAQQKAVSKAQQKAVSKYMKTNYDQIQVRIPKGRKEAVEALAKEHGQSINSLVNALLRGAAGLSEEEWKGKGDAGENA